MIQHHYVEQLERDLEAMTKDRDGLKAALLAEVKQQSDSTRNWAKESAALKIRVGALQRDNAALREALIITTERLSHYVRVPVPVGPGLYATSAEEKASLEVIVKAEEILYPKAKP